jgi:hypothetical protein
MRMSSSSLPSFGGRGWLFADDAFEFDGGGAVELVRFAPGKKLVEDDAERVDIGRGRDGSIADLLRAGVLRCKRGDHGLRCVGIGVKQLGDAEVEEFGRAVGSHKDVGGLEIAVDDEIAVGVLDGFAYLEEELQYLVAGAGLAEVADGDTIDELEDEIRTAIVGLTTVEEASDVGVLKPGKGLTLLLEPAAGVIGVEAVADDLEGYLFAEVILADGGIDISHTTLAELVLNTVALEVCSRTDSAVFKNAGVDRDAHSRTDEGGDSYAVRVAVAEERCHFFFDLGVGDGLEGSIARGGVVELDDLQEGGVDSLALGRCHNDSRSCWDSPCFSLLDTLEFAVQKFGAKGCRHSMHRGNGQEEIKPAIGGSGS